MQKNICAAIDIGTTNTGLAFKLRDEDEVYIEKWGKSVPHKAPTSVLFDASPENRFLAFGYQAEAQYLEMVHNNQPCFFFKNFKMDLHTTKDFDKNIKIPTFNDSTKKLKAVYVFAEMIKYFKKIFLDKINAFGISNESVQWIITVPAIWSGSARQLMREAAYQGGLCSKESLHDLTLALEPESASLAIRENIDKGKYRPYADIDKYMVIDCGGGTVDICVHEVLTRSGNVKVKEIHKATGNAWGGINVNKAFLKYLENLISTHSFNKLRQIPHAWFEIITEFEHAKLQVEANKNSRLSTVVLRMPYEINEVCEKESLSSIVSSGSGGLMSFKRNNLGIELELMHKFFSETIENICQYLEKLLAVPNLHNINTLFLVGGFSASSLLSNRIKSIKINKMNTNKKVLVPPSPCLAIVSGALTYGFYPDIISERIASNTYGLGVSRKFQVGDPEVNKFFNKSNVAYCGQIFDEFIKRDTPITNQNNKIKRNYTPIDADQTQMNIRIHTTTKTEVKYTNEPGVSQVATLTVKMGGYGKNREVEVEIDISGTEIFVTVKDLITKDISFTSVDFLQH